MDLVPARLRARALASLTDPQLGSCRRDLAVAEAREGELLASLGTGEVGDAWRAMREAVGALRVAVLSRDAERGREAWMAVRALLDRGAHDAALWREWRALAELRRRLAYTERQIEESQRNQMAADQVLALAMQLGDIARRVIKDPAVISTLMVEWRAVMDGGVVREPKTVGAGVPGMEDGV